MAKVREDTVQLRRLVEESVRNAEEAVNQLVQFQENKIAFQRDMVMMRNAMHATGHIPDYSKTQGT